MHKTHNDNTLSLLCALLNSQGASYMQIRARETSLEKYPFRSAAAFMALPQRPAGVSLLIPPAHTLQYCSSLKFFGASLNWMVLNIWIENFITRL
jgi:hypothetical protein